ncbi:5-carboxymethyl-2-hydroxymuconate delta isomerase [Streptomyces sp. NRRL F-4489]|uniref:5-carboxymethyl-2-hydroxymuconate Delta-isomerase n=1 Tax=Streptomyces sp. NRRL F-4489 TaxID=1609095 RepID=UPI00074A9AF5|nr:5-carboxymethyl-2-hydroxymuconate delta isomerase [Streptomyces sp. NRRL F-4489]KUL36821.1 5-carboxymethyl-2-hydroxymuconate delta isomerase [Streptomyces sp. NRRL F-4489]
MPHITVDYSAQLSGVFDRQAFVRELHPMVLEETGSAGVCKTFFRSAAETFVGDRGAGQVAFVHVEVGLLPGRPDELKARLAEDVLALLGKHLPAGGHGYRDSDGDGYEVVTSVEVRDLSGAYRLHHAQR